MEWYPKPTLTDVLYDGQQFWLLDDQKIKHVETLTGWLDATEQETSVNAYDVRKQSGRAFNTSRECSWNHPQFRSDFTTSTPCQSLTIVVSFEESIVDSYTPILKYGFGVTPHWSSWFGTRIATHNGEAKPVTHFANAAC